MLVNVSCKSRHGNVHLAMVSIVNWITDALAEILKHKLLIDCNMIYAGLATLLNSTFGPPRHTKIVTDVAVLAIVQSSDTISQPRFLEILEKSFQDQAWVFSPQDIVDFWQLAQTCELVMPM